ncbi:YggS family pyridoxal phosphate-dependent enzyme [Campylobacter aviculae]|uniref:Pyridoxal phosphate homeostasis protein n=1 Tax=Campylobacter aviculae TaxID=2510190 RepID=A0A4U7BJF9_9BACT|nr:YggS family pyridoxal phosphate-dependent enzyme [Campylobacter aviculae]TKX30541.1 YggS family pyridoxal phosphate-dependent enzyme [Campylobacter aviculae]
MNNLEQILEKTKNIHLVAASKYVNSDTIKKFFYLGITDFGENQVQALAQKKEILDDQKLDIKWHFIGTLQSNKINLLIKQNPILWHSCNGLKIAEAVNKRLDYKLDTLLEINSANEESKSGIDLNKAIEEYLQIQEKCPNLNLCGVMSIGSHSQDQDQIKKSFEKTFKIYEALQKYGARICSMGMSNDFELAIQCGSNMVRLGSILFKN